MDNKSKRTFVSFNCKEFKRSVEFVRDLCVYADVIALQETWLLGHDLPLLGSVSDNFEYTSKTAVDTTVGILRGRPYGGVALLWRKGVFDTVSVINCSSVRLTAIRGTIGGKSIIVFSVYMPTDAPDNSVEFVNCLGEIDAIVENNDVEAVYMLGDYNAHPGQPFWLELREYCSDKKWVCADTEKLGIMSNTITFISDIDGSMRWLDHCIVTQTAWKTISNVRVDSDVHWSDHFPLIIEIILDKVVSKINTENYKCNKILWQSRSEAQTGRYHDICHEQLRHIDFPVSLTSCAGGMCHDVTHRRTLDDLYSRVVNILSGAAELTYKDQNFNKKRVTGWNKYVRTAYEDARLKFRTWLLHNKPGYGGVWDDMRESRKVFKSRLRWCQQNEDQVKMDIIASHRSSHDFAKFWRETNKLNVKIGRPTSIGGCSEPRGIANLFKNHFKVTSPLGPPSRVIDAETVTSIPMSFSAKQVEAVIKKMNRGRSPGHDGLSIEHLKHAGNHLYSVLAMFFSLCITHSYLPADMMKTVVVPLVKNKTGDISDKNNYRPICLATVLAKVLDSLIDQNLDRYLNIHDAQFGFVPNLSTESAILCLKQTAQYYTSRKTPVYACFLDLSKAFDLVAYDILWRKLREAGIQSELISLLKFWYLNQENYVKWGETLSDTYRLDCGVRQGGITSPKLFNLYVNELIVGLSSRRVGCWIDGICLNNLSYADDMVLLGPSAGSIRTLLKICEEYAVQHGLTYNVNKSEYMVFVVRGGVIDYESVLKLNDVQLRRVKLFKYLGHYISEDLRDHADIERERRALAARCNMLAHSKKSLDALRVQYNNGFRILLGLRRFCSASAMFTEANTDSFFAIWRKRTASLLNRMRLSSNKILKMFSAKLAEPMLQHFVGVVVRQERLSK
ncbi:uncharacterized protein LOC123665768 [Melitaea cinxia]|uniref:uncharacterized protein LOC123665768 n=1 Tax=Melitaea cinxia TaxID=113334 RepID=UPI001E273035|nr:uncharacterized protein LOC123665768 [Melitaea cinxia]